MTRKPVFTFVFALLFMGLVCPVSAEQVTIEKDVLEKILQRQEALEEKIEMMEKGGKPAGTTTETGYLKEDVEDLSERLDKVETKSILDRITIGGDFRTRMDSFKYRDTLAGGQEDDADVNDLWSSRLRLNLKGEITDNIIFHGRLSYFKLWGDNNFDGMLTDMTAPSISDLEGNIHVERAYLDYFVPGTPLSFTIGRVPSGEGPPNGLRDNTSRKATWPKLVIDGEADGIIANLSLDKWTGLTNSMFRLVYAKIFQNYQDYMGVNLDDSPALTAAFEMEVPGIEDSMVWLSYTKILDLPSLTSVPESVPLTVTGFPDNSGDMDLFVFHLQFNDIKKSGLDWFLASSYLKTRAGSDGTEFFGGLYEVGLFGDNLNGNLGDDQDGYCIYTGLRYELPVEALKYPKIGLEYSHGSKHWTGLLSAGSGDIINKIGVNGNTYELYYIQPIDKKHMFLRFGAVYMDYDYYNPMMVYGSQPESDMSITNYYCLMDVRF